MLGCDSRESYHEVYVSAPKLCIIQYNASRFLTRVDRAARTLAEAGWEVVLVGIKDDDTPEIEHRNGYTVKRVTLKSRALPRGYGLKFLRFAEGIWRTFVAAYRENADVYDARDAYPLFVAHAVATLRGSAVVYDSDELATGRNWSVASNPLWSWAMRRYEGFFARRSVVITSDYGRADAIEQLYGIPRPAVVLNVPNRMETIDPDERFRARALGDRRYVLLYQGVVIPNRGLPEMVAAMAQLPECRLAIVGYGSLLEQLRADVAASELAGAVEFFDPVPFQTLMRYTAAADIGVIPLIGSCRSYRTAAPNKLFEYMMASIPVVATDLPDMARVVRETKCGTLIAEPVTSDSIASAVRELIDGSEPLASVGERGRAAALDRYNWERERYVLLDAFSEVRLSARRRRRLAS